MNEQTEKNQFGDVVMRMLMAGVLLGLAWGFGQAGQKLLTQTPSAPPPPNDLLPSSK